MAGSSWRSSCAFLVVGGLTGRLWPGLRVVFGLPPVFMGITACLAYMFIDLERNEVERGYKAVHNPLKGQALALNLELYGRHLRLPYLGCATVALIGGFALLNQGLYETIGRGWYQVANAAESARYMSTSWLTLSHKPWASWTCWTCSSRTISWGRHRFEWPPGQHKRCSPGSNCSSRWFCSIRSSHPCDRESCWLKRSPISGVPTSRSTSGLGMRYRVTVLSRSAHCWGHCAWCRR